MAIFTSILTSGSNNHLTTSEEANRFATNFITPGFAGTLVLNTGSGGGTGSFAINAQGTPNNTVSIGTGDAYVQATPTGQASQVLNIRSTTTQTITIAANVTGSPRYDYIYLSVDPSKAANPAIDASDVASIVVNRSTSNTTDTVGAPAYSLLIGMVTVASGFSSIPNSAISDRRVVASPPILDGSITLSKLSAAANPAKVVQPLHADFVQSGLVFSTSATLTSSYTGGTAWINGKIVTVSSSTLTVTASKDTYIDLKDDGTLVPVPVANGAGTGMTLTTNSDGTNALRIAKLVSSGTGVTRVYQGLSTTPSGTQEGLGLDPIGNVIYNMNPISAFNSMVIGISISDGSSSLKALSTFTVNLPYTMKIQAVARGIQSTTVVGTGYNYVWNYDTTSGSSSNSFTTWAANAYNPTTGSVVTFVADGQITLPAGSHTLLFQGQTQGAGTFSINGTSRLDFSRV